MQDDRQEYPFFYFDDVETAVWEALTRYYEFAHPMANDFAEALNAGRCASKTIKELLARGLEHPSTQNSIATAIRDSARAELRATGILVVLAATIDDLLRQLLGEKRKHPTPFGPIVGNDYFGTLLLAGANNVRHGHEWGRVSDKDVYHAKLSERADAMDALATAAQGSLAQRQRHSVEPLSRLLNMVPPDIFPSWQVLDRLADGSFPTLKERFMNTVGDVARAADRFDAFETANQVFMA